MIILFGVLVGVLGGILGAYVVLNAAVRIGQRSAEEYLKTRLDQAPKVEFDGRSYRLSYDENSRDWKGLLQRKQAEINSPPKKKKRKPGKEKKKKPCPGRSGS